MAVTCVPVNCGRINLLALELALIDRAAVGF